MNNVPTTSQFKSAKTPSGKKAFEAWVAVYMNYGKHAAIAAPTLDTLKEVYAQLTGRELIADAAQHVWIVRAEKDELQDAPRAAPAAAHVACCVKNCKNEASFIIDREAYCYAHKI